MSSSRFEKEWLPTRLVDLGTDDNIIRPRIRNSAGLPLGTKYTTLSHRWGASTPPRLILENVREWSIRIPISELQPLYRDSMEASKRLGVQYIWIDSLCIIQDSVQDWQIEAAAMGDVYQRSYCNFAGAAKDTPGSHGGLFVSRNPVDIELCVVKPKNALLRTHPAGTAYYCFDMNIWENNITQSPLYDRGWVLQERILSPRVLHFTGQQVFWECLELQACESLPGGMPHTWETKAKLTVDTFSLVAILNSMAHLQGQAVEPHFLWESIVERYSETSLTYPEKDKLAALSGVAKKVGLSVEGGGYVAGIWKDRLPVHLLWRPDNYNSVLRATEYQAPSWSWASINSKIQVTSVWPGKKLEVVAEVLEAHVDLVSNDPTGQVCGGYLRLRGCLATVTCRKNMPYTRFTPMIGDINAPRAPDYETLDCATIRCLPDIETSDATTEFHVFIINLRYTKDEFRAEGLLLEPTGKKGQFNRRGVFDGIPVASQELQVFLDLFMCSAEQLSPKNYERKTEYVDPVCGFPQYELSII
ncbi:heterokaryon incompatibility protein-domain-containing protein [Trichophaea hybrida]|nr:heterokaryon incompatibility protein-domain-containing protein [Trichophaea hybrida]